MAQSRILLVEKDEEMRVLIGGLLLAQFSDEISITNASCGVDALQFLANSSFDLLIMDWTLPELSGMDFLKRVRGEMPLGDLDVLVMLKDSAPEVHLQAIEAGATDYLVEPFDRNTLLTRVKGLLRRHQKNETPWRIVFGKLVIDTRSFDVYAGAERIHLTPSEFKLLQALVERRGSVLTREILIQLVQGQGISVVDRAVDTHVFGLRKKLGESGDDIETVRGVGYRIK